MSRWCFVCDPTIWAGQFAYYSKQATTAHHHELPNKASAGCDRGSEEEKEERLISSQLHRGGVGDAPAADNGSLSPPPPYTHKHTLSKHWHIYTRAHTSTLGLLCFHSLHGQQQALWGWTFLFCQQLQFITKQNQKKRTTANPGIITTQWRTHLSFIHFFQNTK